MSLSKVKIKISSQVKNEGDPIPERTEEEVLGIMRSDANEGALRISYKTASEGAATETAMELYGSSVRLIRSGAVESNILFEAGKSHASLYRIPPFSFDMSVKTTRLENNLAHRGGSLILEYEMKIGGAKKLCFMHLSVTPC